MEGLRKRLGAAGTQPAVLEALESIEAFLVDEDVVETFEYNEKRVTAANIDKFAAWVLQEGAKGNVERRPKPKPKKVVVD